MVLRVILVCKGDWEWIARRRRVAELVKEKGPSACWRDPPHAGPRFNHKN